ncbi:hypothetical protein [Kocuria soli]|nr:hypothetical protein [Kocuria soli]
MANPLACAVALQSVRMLRKTWSENVARLSAALSEILPVALTFRWSRTCG